MITHSLIDELAYEETYVSPDVLLLEQLDKLIDLHFRERKDPTFYASELACGIQKLNHIVKQYTQQTVFMLLQNRILLESKRMLLAGGIPVKLIAYELGFEYPSYFCRFFKKMTGMRAKEYRKCRQDR